MCLTLHCQGTVANDGTTRRQSEKLDIHTQC